MNPILTIAGIVPGAPEMTNWRSGMNRPTSGATSSFRGPCISMAGVTFSTPTVSHWRTSYPNGESIYVDALRRADAQAALESKVSGLPRRSTSRRAPRGGQPKAA